MVSATATEHENSEEQIELVEDSYTQQELAKLYLENLKEPENSMKSDEWFAIRGYAPAQFMLGLQAFDPINTIKWYQIAADNGHTSAQHNLAYIYYTGQKGVLQDYAKAFKLYKILADNDDVRAQYQLGDMYYHDAGTHQSYSQAFNYYQKATDNGLERAEYSLGLMYCSRL